MKGDVKSKQRLTWLLNHFLGSQPLVFGATPSRSASDMPRQKTLCLFQYARLNLPRPDRRIGQCWEATRAPSQGRTDVRG